MFIDPFVILLALLPLLGYLLVLGVIRLSGQVLVTTGGRDIVALGFAVAGLIAVGPGELFFPNPAAGLFGPWVWFALVTFYGLIVLLLAMTSRPRLVVYGRCPEQLVESLAQAAAQMDDATTVDSATRQVHMPNQGIRLRVAGQVGVDFAAIESFEPVVSPIFWNRLLGHLRRSVAQTPPAKPRGGVLMTVIALLLLALTAYVSFQHTDRVVEGFRQWLWR